MPAPNLKYPFTLYYGFQHDRRTLAKGHRTVNRVDGKLIFSAVTITWHHEHGETQMEFEKPEAVKDSLPDCNAYWSAPDKDELVYERT